MIYCFSQVSGHQLPGNNLLWKQHESCQWTNDNLICSSQPELGFLLRNVVAPARKTKKIFYSNDAAFIKTNSQWAALYLKDN